jgi:hypothetical protein
LREEEMTYAFVVPTRLGEETIAKTRVHLPHSLRLRERRATTAMLQAAETSGYIRLKANDDNT